MTRRKVYSSFGFVSIATAYLGFLKTTCHDTSLVAGIMRHGMGLNSGPFISHLNQALFYTSEALRADQFASRHYHRTTTLLDKCEEAIEAMVRVGHVIIRGVNPEACHPGLPFREELLKHNLTSYIEKRIREQPGFFNIFDELPLFAALTPMSLNSGESPAPVARTLDVLLQRGADPNVLPQVRGLYLEEAALPWVLFARGTMSVFNMLAGPLMFPALRWNDSLNNALFDLLMSYDADPNQALLDRPGAHTVFSHFLEISTSRFLGEDLGVPYNGTVDPDALAAFGNLARSNPEETVLASYCTELKGLMSKLAAGPGRAKFLASVTEKFVVHCSGGEEDLERLSLAILEGLPQYVAEPLLQVVDNKLEMGKKRGDTRKRRRGSRGDSAYGGDVKQLRGE
ncbi:uncharacterized protein Triagg1_2034 [Trichoderma aggressivum f. europaeum]|uniref:Uncharacterized protein n=1 Tax=Trichoderma aggressivum f. europaeum TaxID=173218 RepID=A0AAE1IJ58_9HYPO|nr:hypothetical protein Triagg1_2034 [Trichoderma aggressivum f. europaeum]